MDNNSESMNNDVIDNSDINAGEVAAAPSDTENESISARAAAKIEEELKSFKGGNKETAVSKFVASTLTRFCEENERFAEVVYKTSRTLSDCCAEVMAGCGNTISDIDVYRGAVQSYFPNADIVFKMEITITGDDPTDEELSREPKVKTPAPKQQREQNNKTEKAQDAPNKTSKPAAKTARPASQALKSEKKPDTIQLTLFSDF